MLHMNPQQSNITLLKSTISLGIKSLETLKKSDEGKTNYDDNNNTILTILIPCVNTVLSILTNLIFLKIF